MSWKRLKINVPTAKSRWPGLADAAIRIVGGCFALACTEPDGEWQHRRLAYVTVVRLVREGRRDVDRRTRPEFSPPPVEMSLPMGRRERERRRAAAGAAAATATGAASRRHYPSQPSSPERRRGARVLIVLAATRFS